MRRMWITIGLSVVLSVPALVAATKTKSGTAANTAAEHKTPEYQTNLKRWEAQNLTGTISMVDPKMELVVVRDSSGVPFDFKIARSTRIDAGAKREELSELTPKESVSIHYVPEARGDIARSIQVQH
ncbi:MAG: hypothetical protein ACLPWF_18995 [Bryobacteraceae bacterium]